MTLQLSPDYEPEIQDQPRRGGPLSPERGRPRWDRRSPTRGGWIGPDGIERPFNPPKEKREEEYENRAEPQVNSGWHMDLPN